MGVIHFAVNVDMKQAYELGKGGWYRIANEDHRVDVTNVESLASDIRREVISERYGWDAKVAEDGAYAKSIAEALSQLGPEVEIRDDSHWEDPTKGLTVIGTRYL